MKWSKIVFTIFYSAFVTYLVFFARRREHLAERYINIIPIKTTIIDFQRIEPGYSKNAYNFYTNLIGNIILFIPLPMVLGWIFESQSKRRILLYGIMVSLSIEVTQYIFKIGVADVDDLILNAIGTLIGLVLIHIVKPNEFQDAKSITTCK